MLTTKYVFDWNDLAFASKKPLSSLKATFIMAPRELSETRLKQIVKQYLSLGNVVLGISSEPFVVGFEDQQQFKMLRYSEGNIVNKLVSKIAEANTPYKMYILQYFQRDIQYVVDKIVFTKFVSVNGSYKLAFHNLPVYYSLTRKSIPIDHISPFIDENEAEEYERDHKQSLDISTRNTMTENEVMEVVDNIKKSSFDYCTQVGAALVKKIGNKYKLLARDYNAVVPKQWQILHYGSEREKSFSPPQDINHHDTIHAEMRLLINSARNKIPLDGTSLFINLMPCPACARTLSQTDIEEFVYQFDYAEGYGVGLLEKCGKKVRRLVE